jgi:hypothetical protein
MVFLSLVKEKSVIEKACSPARRIKYLFLNCSSSTVATFTGLVTVMAL